MDTKVLEQMEEIFSEEIELLQHDLEALKAVGEEKMRLFGMGLMQRMSD